MKKMTAMPIYGKKLKNLLQAQWADCLETWFAHHHFGFVILRLQKIVSSYPKQISHCSLSVQGSDKDLMVLLFEFVFHSHVCKVNATIFIQ